MCPEVEIMFSSGDRIGLEPVKVPIAKPIVVRLTESLIGETGFDEQGNHRQLIILSQTTIRRTLDTLLPFVQKSGDAEFDCKQSDNLTEIADEVLTRASVNSLNLRLDPVTEGTVDGDIFSFVSQQALTVTVVAIVNGLSLSGNKKDRNDQREVEDLRYRAIAAGYRLLPSF